MHWFKLIKITAMLFPICVLLMSAGCCSPRIEQRYIAVRPKLEPLPAETLQAMQPNSTELLKKADTWYESSGQLLDSVTSK